MSLDALAGSVIAALALGDTAGLQALRLTEHEHNDLVWPELPASNSKARFPVDFAWDNIQTRSAAALSELLPRYAGRALELRDVGCRGAEAEFVTFRVLTDCWVAFEVDGEAQEHQLFKDVLVMDAGHKIFRYYSDR